MSRTIAYIAILSCLFLLACEKQYSWDFETENLSILVVDGIITNQMQPQEICLSITNTELNQGLTPLSEAIVRVDDNTNIFEFSESQITPGLYVSESFQALIDVQYHLMVILHDDTFEAYADTEPVTPLDSLVLAYDSTRNLSRFIFQDGGRPAMIKVHYDWSVDTAYCREYGHSSAQETYYVLGNTDINDIFAPAKALIYFPDSTVIIREKFSLTEPHQQFIRSLLMETDWRGGFFDVQHGNVRTNISKGALGFFAACMLVSDTTIVEVGEYGE